MTDQDTSATIDMTIEDILAGFERYDGKYKRQHVDAALRQKEAITPHLLNILDRLLAAPDVDQDYYAHMYAVMLLGHFREPQAHQRIVDLFSLPERTVESLFSDIVTEDLPALLSNTCNGSLEGIKRLALNQNAYEFCRTSAIQAIVYAVIEGFVSREEALTFLGTLLAEGENNDPDSLFYDEVAVAIYKLYPGEYMDVIEAAYKRGLIEDDFIPLEDFQKALEKGKDACLQETKQEISERVLTDMHDSMAWWYCFQPKTERPTPTYSLIDPLPKQPSPPTSTMVPKATKVKKKKAFWQL
jgi:hypothetical protein